MFFKKLAVRIVFALNLVVALMLIGVYVSVYIHPASFWPAPFFGLMFPYILLANIVFIFFWLFARYKYFLLSLILVIAGFNHIKSNYRIGSKPKKTQYDIAVKVLSYNVQMNDLAAGSKKNSKQEDILRLIRTESPDIVCFQELNCRHGKAYNVPAEFQNTYRHKYINIKCGDRVSNYGLGIWSVFPLFNKGEIRFQGSFNFCVYSDLIIHGDTVRVYNVHLQSVGFLSQHYVMIDSLSVLSNTNRMQHAHKISSKLRYAFIKRAEQAEILLAHIASSPYRVMVCGDFNDSPVSYTYRLMSRNLDDAYKMAGSGSGHTYIGRIPSYRIDYIFYDKSFTVLSFNKPRVKASDHYPVLATFMFSKP